MNLVRRPMPLRTRLAEPTCAVSGSVTLLRVPAPMGTVARARTKASSMAVVRMRPPWAFCRTNRTVHRAGARRSDIRHARAERESVLFQFRHGVGVLYAFNECGIWRNWKRNIDGAEVVAHLILNADADGGCVDGKVDFLLNAEFFGDGLFVLGLLKVPDSNARQDAEHVAIVIIGRNHQQQSIAV